MPRVERSGDANYRYGSAKENTETEQFLARLVAHDKVSRASATNAAPETLLQSESSHARSGRPGARLATAKFIVSLISVAYFGAGALGTVMFLMHEHYLIHIWTEIAASFLALCALFVLLALMGLCVIFMKSKLVVGLYCVVQTIAVLAAAVCLWAVLEAKGGHLDPVKYEWRDLLHSNPTALCIVEKQLKCSGWGSVCESQTPAPQTPAPTSTPQPRTNSPATPPPHTIVPRTPEPGTPAPKTAKPTHEPVSPPAHLTFRTQDSSEVPGTPEPGPLCPDCSDYHGSGGNPNLAYNKTCAMAVEEDASHLLLPIGIAAACVLGCAIICTAFAMKITFWATRVEHHDKHISYDTYGTGSFY